MIITLWILTILGFLFVIGGACNGNGDGMALGVLWLFFVGIFGWAIMAHGIAREDYVPTTDFKVTKLATIAIVECHGMHKDYEDVLAYNAVDKLKTIYIHRTWDYYGNKSEEIALEKK